MPSAIAPLSNAVLRNLPSVDELLRSPKGCDISADAGDEHAAAVARKVIGDIRDEIMSRAGSGQTKDVLFALAVARLDDSWRSEKLAGIHRVINATGVVIHTNLGRAPLSDNARWAVADEASGYCTLEYDLETGKRGRRGFRSEETLAELTGAEGVLIVNNCAAAAFFVLTAFAAGGEVVISRGELVEIGGDFRVPDVLTQSGATLREVGTTNRTKLADYEKALGENTKVILRVHPSNYRIVGFTAMPSLSDIAELAHRNGILLYEDLGSGALIDFGGFGLTDEPVVSDSIRVGVDIVTFSGDKLLGGPQAGIIAGRAEFIDRLRKHPLYRALRVDKLTYAALDATLDAYRRSASKTEIPVLRMLALTKIEITERARNFVQKLGALNDLNFELIDGESAIGGGAAPAVKLETKLVAIKHRQMSASRLEDALRNSTPPVITRIVEDRVVIDLRTVRPSDDAELLRILLETEN